MQFQDIAYWLGFGLGWVFASEVRSVIFVVLLLVGGFLLLARARR